LYGGTNNDNSNNLANFEFRLRIPFLRNTEIYGEDTFEDLPSAESYLAGIYVPRLTGSGRDDLRFEYFRGHNILYTNATFPEGYIYHGLPLGHPEGGATEEFFVRYGHWFAVRTKLALDYYYRTRGTFGRLPLNSSGQVDLNGTLQAVERTNGLRVWWNMPVVGRIDAECMYGWERVKNFDLVGGMNKTNQLVKVDLTYRF
ncbi:MAG TPA: capsule assembly Wzi family protein, partial [Geobacteraceae bacterium]